MILQWHHWGEREVRQASPWVSCAYFPDSINFVSVIFQLTSAPFLKFSLAVDSWWRRGVWWLVSIASRSEKHPLRSLLKSARVHCSERTSLNSCNLAHSACIPQLEFLILYLLLFCHSVVSLLIAPLCYVTNFSLLIKHLRLGLEIVSPAPFFTLPVCDYNPQASRPLKRHNLFIKVSAI